jgi:hypothetical protein
MTRSQHPPERPDRRVSVDDAWILEWADDGHRQIDRLLAVHAAFDRYVAERDPTGGRDGGDGDRRIDGT